MSFQYYGATYTQDYVVNSGTGPSARERGQSGSSTSRRRN
jgi:hypothetical protein